jgi:glutamate racemase
VTDRAIGVFDSGIGGLTVVKELLASVPHERIVYFGDTARVPYGTKSVETIERYAREDTELLLAQDVKMIVVACNTVSATALPAVQSMTHGLPVIGMIEPTAEEAVRATSSGRIGIIGTEATIASGAYERAIQFEAAKQSKTVETVGKACPLFVPLAEEGWIEHNATRLVAEEYLAYVRERGVDTLILGCTHYPVLTSIIQDVMGAGVTLINSGAAAAQRVMGLLVSDSSEVINDHLVLVSDVPRKFQRIGERFLGRALPEARQVQWKESWVIRREFIGQDLA